MSAIHEITIGRDGFQRIYILQENRYFIEFNRGLNDEEIAEFLQAYELEILEMPQQRPEQLPPEVIYNHNQSRWVEATGGQDMSDLLASDNVARIAPMYVDSERGESSSAAPLPDVLLVETQPDAAIAVSEALTKMFQLEEVAHISELLGDFLYFTLPTYGESETTVYGMVNEVTSVDGVRYAEFDWVMQQADTNNPLDALWAQQWNMVRVRAGGDGLTGWDISKGQPGVVIAIVDSGCDLGHPDLMFTAPDTHFNAKQLANGVQANFDASPVRTHGTAVAGIAAARTDNDGVAGMAGDCLLLPAYHGDTAAGAATAVNWAVNHGVKVINLSCQFTPTASLATAIQSADQAGVIVVAAAGNDSQQGVVFPANMPETIAVGAINQDDVRQAINQNGEFWGSNWGIELDVMAPGLLIPTTDLQGWAGYNNTPGIAGDYNINFWGTSAAAPHVAGLAALIWSHCPNLGHHQVRTLIESTCEKVQSNVLIYAHNAQHPNGSWNTEMGYGLINVVAALQACAGNGNENQPDELTTVDEIPEQKQGDNDEMNDNLKNHILDENGTLQTEFLNQGTLLTRYGINEATGNVNQVTLTWVPDDPDQTPVREVINIPDLGGPQYRNCLNQNANRGVSAIFMCAPLLVV